MDPDVGPGGSTGQDPTTVSGGVISYSHRAVPHYPQVPSSDSLHCACILLFLFLFHFSTTYLLLLVAPGVSEYLGSSVSDLLPSGAQRPMQGSPSLWLTPCPGRPPGLHGTGLLTISGLSFSGNVRPLIIQMFSGQNTEHRHGLSPLCQLLTHM